VSHELIPTRPAGAPARSVLLSPPALVARKGKKARSAFRDFFLARYPNENTREAYARAVACFLTWLEARGVPDLDYVEPSMVGLYLDELAARYKTRTVKQHLSAIRMCFDHLTREGILPTNPAIHVRGPKLKVVKGVTPVLEDSQVLDLFESIDTSTIVGLRDRALIGIMLFTWARVSAVCGLHVRDYHQGTRKTQLFLGEKGGREHRVILHHKAEEFLDAYLVAAGIAGERESFLFRSIDRARRLTDRPLSRMDVLAMVKRRGKRAGIAPERVCNHSFRATGITNYMEHGGRIDVAKEMAGHADERTTGLYDRSTEKVTKEEVERIRFERDV